MPEVTLTQSTNQGYIISNYNMKCHCCDYPIKRGDEITQCKNEEGMKLRVRTIKNKGFYTPYTGSWWVHKECNPYRIWTYWYCNYSGCVPLQQ